MVTHIFVYIFRTNRPLTDVSRGMSQGGHFSHLLEALSAPYMSIPCQGSCLPRCSGGWEAVGSSRGTGAGELGWSLKSCGLTW